MSTAGPLLHPLLVAPVLLAATVESGATRARREQLDADRQAEQDDRKRRARSELVQAGAGSTATEQLHAAERDLRPTSRAGRRAAAHEQTLKDQYQKRDAFQQALVHARTPASAPERSSQRPPPAPPPPQTPAAEARSPEMQAIRPSQTPGDRPMPRSADAQPEPRSGPGAMLQAASVPALRAAGVVPHTAYSAAAQPATEAAVTVARLQSPATFQLSRVAAASASYPGQPGPRGDSGPAALSVEGARQAPRASALRPAASGLGSLGPESSPGANMERILRTLRAQIREERATATVRLDPPELGVIRLRLDLQQARLALRIEAQTELARGLLEGQLDDLRRGLEAAGLQLETVSLRPLGESAAAQPGLREDATGEQPETTASQREAVPQEPDQHETGIAHEGAREDSDTERADPSPSALDSSGAGAPEPRRLNLLA